MAYVKAQIVNGFTKGDKGGNPAGVVMNADQYSEEEMLRIAQEIGLSETAFVSRSQRDTYKLDFFTPNQRIAHCGHATIATFSYLAAQGLIQEGEASKETVDGSRKILIQNGAAYMEQLAPTYDKPSQWCEVVDKKDVLAALDLFPSDLIEGAPILKVNTGNSFVIIPVKNSTILQNLKPDFDLIEDISNKLDLIGFYVFTQDHADNNIAATTRMFAPRYSIKEESATGMAAGPLACYLYDYLEQGSSEMTIEQGAYMTPRSPSLINVSLNVHQQKITGLMAGGHGKAMDELELKL
ncbi:PhzF family phenazine biosynthesis protein [Vibrio sp. RE86]|uniref:PhzF family phenazine biosynthesis protein n=1 Tax=Vibrio sp. RE86 TaxID=2607605 RepID=UPI0014938613|nr:PhzF family phenazine biosynthesis protein [Vibrio sp. RE86]NOH78701.1 PhzF family phenazine biosynthesis protein [Vibrio sp. RE86]